MNKKWTVLVVCGLFATAARVGATEPAPLAVPVEQLKSALGQSNVGMGTNGEIATVAHVEVVSDQESILAGCGPNGCTETGSGLWAGCCDGGAGCEGTLGESIIGSCGDCGSDMCGDCEVCPRRCTFGVFGEFLYLRPRDAEVAFGVPTNGPITDPPTNNPIQVGGYGIVDPEYRPAFRAGVSYSLDEARSLVARYSRFESNTTNVIATEAPDVIRSLVSHPSSASAATDFLQAGASYDIDFELVDVEFQYLWLCGSDYAVNYVVGARYAKLDQEFQAAFVNNGTELVASSIGFDGGGIRLGLDGQRYAPRGCWHVYGKGDASFLAGQFRSRYFQGQSFDPVVVDTAWKSGRVVPILDVEAGIGWTSRSGRVRFSAGYVFSAWFNSVKTNEFIQAVQSNNVLNLGDTVTFDGVASRLEIRF